MSEFNLPLLRKCVDWAVSESKKPLAESEWFQGTYAIDGAEIGRTCGTAYCIAGYAAFADDKYHVIDTHRIDFGGDARIAIELLGITYEEAWGMGCGLGLFGTLNSIEDVQEIAAEIARRHGEEL